MITSLTEEYWDLQGRPDTDPETGCARVHVRHITTAGTTVFRLVKLPTRSKPEGDWRKVGFFSGATGRYMKAPERKGQPLSNSRMDLVLLAHVTGDFSHV